MKLKDLVEKLEAHSEFKEWRKVNKDSYLAHAFLMLDKANENAWQVGYYNPKTDKMTTFIIEGDEIKMSPELDIFKRPGCTVEKLDISKVAVGSIEAVERAEEVMASEYPKANPIKMFFIIQNVPEQGAIYNITFITADFKAVNIRLSSENAEVLCHKLESIIDFKK